MKDNFDDILRRKLEEQHFPVDDTHRQEMIELLHGKKRRGILPLWWLGSLVIVASLAGYFYVSEKDNSQPAHPIQNEEIRQNTPVTENQQAPSIANAESTGNSAPAINTKESSSTNFATNQPAQSAETNMPSTVSAKSINQSTVNTKSTTNPNTTLNTNSISEQKTKSTATETSGITITTNLQAKEQSTALRQPTTYLVEGEILTTATIVSQAAAVTIEDPDAYLQPEPEVVVENENSLLLFPQERLTRHTDFVDALEMGGVEYTSTSGMNKIIPKTTFKKMLFLFGEAGVGMVLPSLPEYTSGWKVRGGVGIGYKLSPKVQLSWSAGYLLQVGGFDFERTSTINQPSFGTRSSSNTLTPDKLHFVYSRIGMQYRLHRHLFGVHGGMQWLYGAQGTIVTKVQDQFVSETSESATYGWVKTDGLRQLHWTADVSYGYQLTSRLVATVGTDFYFSSIAVPDAALTADGYYWDGAFSSLHPFITLNYHIYGR